MAPVESPTGNSCSDAWIKGKASPSANLPKGSAPDPCRILEPSKKNLQMLESQRIMAVLEDTIKRIELVTVLEQVIKSIPRFGVVLGAYLVELLDCHSTRMEKYQSILVELEKEEKRLSRCGAPVVVFTTDSDSDTEQEDDSTTASHHNRRWEMLKKDTAIAEQGLKYSLMDILRYFKKNPKAVQVILGSKLPCVSVHRRFVEYMALLQGVMKERLLTSPAEETGRKRYIVDILTRERKTNTAKERLQLRYKEAVRDKEYEISKRNSIINQLKNEVLLIEKVTREKQRKTLSDAAKQCGTETKSFESKKVNMREDMIRLRRGVRDTCREHKEDETVMRKRAFKIGTEVFNWVQKYDSDMGARQDEYDKIFKLYEDDKQDLAEMQKEFEKMEEKYDAILEEKRLAAEAAKRREEEIVLRNIAATGIQALWRGHRVRKGLRGGKKGAKKGKKGKK